MRATPAADRANEHVRRASTARLLGAQVSYQLRVLVRSPIGSFATLVIPLMVLLAVSLLFEGTRISSLGNIRYIQFFTPAMVSFAVVTACYMSVVATTTLARDEGVLKRIRSTPLPVWVYMAGRIMTAGLVSLVSSVVVIAVGVGVYGFHVIWGGAPVAIVNLLVAMFCFCSLGLAVTVLVPTADSALPIAWGSILPLCFISDVFQPIESAPRWLGVVASCFPLRPFADDLESAFNPVTGTQALNVGHLAVIAGWGVGAAAFALALFRWQPAATDRGGLGSAGSGPIPTQRVRDLLQARGHTEPATPVMRRAPLPWDQPAASGGPPSGVERRSGGDRRAAGDDLGGDPKVTPEDVIGTDSETPAPARDSRADESG